MCTYLYMFIFTSPGLYIYIEEIEYYIAIVVVIHVIGKY